MTKLKTKLKVKATVYILLISFNCFAPKNCATTTPVALEITVKAKERNVNIWPAFPNAPTAFSEYWLTIIVSMYPKHIERSIWKKIGQASLKIE